MTATTDPQTPPAELPVLPIRNTVLFPGISMPLVVGRPKSLAALDKAEATGRMLLIVAQKNITSGDPESRDLFKVGTLCKIENVSPGENGGRQIVVTGIARYRVLDYREDPREKSVPSANQALWARGEIVADQDGSGIRTQGLFESLKQLALEIIELMPGTTEALIRLIDRMDDPAYLTHVTSAYLNLNLSQKQELLETLDLNQRMEKLIELLGKEKEVLGIQKEIRDKMSERLSKAQREALLREQLKTIRGELGEEGAEEVSEDLEEKLARAKLPEEASRQAQEELKRLRQLPSASAEYHVVRTYLEWLASLPWSWVTPDTIDLAAARKILDEDHAGLEAVKKRILQFLAVAKLKNDLSGPILCLVGPPGVGKTSLGQSIARAVGRKFIRASLGGVRDEAEIRGHRRTYVGAMPGRIVQSIKRAGTRNPIMMLDEIDKMRADFQGDPSSAMLEVLDPEQNHSFVDHYLDVPFDLSKVFFIATANVLETIPPPLRDRMEVIEVNGYTTDEKLIIASKHLFLRQLKENGMTPGQLEVPNETWLSLITHYTREAGVRELQRKIASLIRSAAEKIVTQPERPLPLRVEPERLHEFLGPRKFEPEVAERTPRPGMATGLAWTPHGGDILFIEAAKMQGKGSLVLTGQLGDVMRESAQIALSLARSMLQREGPGAFDFSQNDIHIHVPAGGIPKDGPSAGVTLVTALVSLLRDTPVDPLLGMTGEITLRGVVLPVGGIKEKLIAAHRAGLRRILLPARNAPDLEDVPKPVLEALKIEFVTTTDEVLSAVFDLERKAA
jgi:ATP-dependent Lon protease